MGYLLLTGSINIFVIAYYFGNTSTRESQFVWTLRFTYLTSHVNQLYCHCFNVACLVLKNWGETMWPVSGFLSLCYCTDHCQLIQILFFLTQGSCLPRFAETDTLSNHLMYCIYVHVSQYMCMLYVLTHTINLIYNKITSRFGANSVNSRLTLTWHLLTVGYHRNHLELLLVQWPNMLMTPHNLKLKIHTAR